MMIAFTLPNVIGLIWLSFCLLSTSVAIGFFIWAIRAKQFKNQEHARYLPLEAGDLDDEKEGEEEEEGKDEQE